MTALFTSFGRAAALAVAAAGFFTLAAPAPATAHGTHYDCRQHGFRPYPHRHVDPGAQVVRCDRSAVSSGDPAAAVCEALARRRGGSGHIVEGTQSTSAVPLNPYDGAPVRAEAMNVACEQALAVCDEAAFSLGARRAECQVIDQRFEN